MHCVCVWRLVRGVDSSGRNIGPLVEPMTGIEPAYSAWEADVLPLNYIGVAAGRRVFAPDQRAFEGYQTPFPMCGSPARQLVPALDFSAHKIPSCSSQHCPICLVIGLR